MKNFIVEYRCKDEKNRTVQIESDSSDPDIVKRIIEKKHRNHKPLNVHKIIEII
jgi:hypothetical protein